ncbi:MAG: alginate lyase family protein [Candidatus Hydrogenedentota bacterium]
MFKAGSTFFLVFFLCAGVSAEFIHPGILHTRAELDFVKAKIDSGEEPWATAWAGLCRSEYAQLSWKPEPVAHVERGPYNKPDIGATPFMRGGFAAYMHALQWVFTEDEAHAQKAREILNAWSTTLQSVGQHDARLLVGMTGINYCNAAELLKHTWDGWPASEQEPFSSMLRDVFYPIIENFYPFANGNWDASMIQTMMAMGVFLDDEAMFLRAVDYCRSGKGNGAINNYFKPSGQCQESGRDQWHVQMGLEYLANACEIAWKQGVDLYSAYDHRLAKGFEYTAKYNLIITGDSHRLY